MTERAIMTSESIARIRDSFFEVSAEPRALAGRFYEELFTAAPRLRQLFPADLTSLQGHFEAALALVVRNLEELPVLEQSLRDLGAQHVAWGARPEDYRIVRASIVRAVRTSAKTWNDVLEDDWHQAITAIIVPMLEGAAVQTAMVAEQFREEKK
jgi:hemoglobin-like flavoprotein